MNDIIKNTILTGRQIGKYLAKDRTKSAKREIESWLKEDPRNQSIFDELKNEENLAETLEELEQYNAGMAWKMLVQKALLKQKERMISRWKIAAVIILLLGLGGATAQFIFNRNTHSPLSALNTTVKTERGQTSKVILPDSSIVYLNSATELVYSNNFLVENRSVTVKGEAYFKVTKDPEHPFLVNCDEVQVKVLGTEFNVRTDADEHLVDVILDQGRVELQHVRAKFESTFMTPGERAQFNENNNHLEIGSVDSYKFTSWKDGILIFEDEPMREVFKKLESWYDVDIEIRDNRIYDLKFNATIMDESLEDLFALMKYSCNIKYEINYSREPQVSSKVIVMLK